MQEDVRLRFRRLGCKVGSAGLKYNKSSISTHGGRRAPSVSHLSGRRNRDFGGGGNACCWGIPSQTSIAQENLQLGTSCFRFSDRPPSHECDISPVGRNCWCFDFRTADIVFGVNRNLFSSRRASLPSGWAATSVPYKYLMSNAGLCSDKIRSRGSERNKSSIGAHRG